MLVTSRARDVNSAVAESHRFDLFDWDDPLKPKPRSLGRQNERFGVWCEGDRMSPDDSPVCEGDEERRCLMTSLICYAGFVWLKAYSGACACGDDGGEQYVMHDADTSTGCIASQSLVGHQWLPAGVMLRS